MITPTNSLPDISWQDLKAAPLTFNSPFQLVLREGDIFFADKVVRMVPKKRMVAFGTWRGKAVVAKLFFDAVHAKRHLERDSAGIKVLAANKIPAPQLYYEGASVDQRVLVLIFERLVDTVNLDDLWQNPPSQEALLLVLKSVIIELATQHVMGVLQHDLHLKNFLIQEQTIYTLDGAAIESFPHLLPKKISMNNLALFLSQLGAGSENLSVLLFKHYAKARGWLLKEEDMKEMALLIKKWSTERWQRFEKKIFRECTDFFCVRGRRTAGMCARAYAGPELISFFNDPDAIFNHTHITLLKAGRSATVIKVKLDDRCYVIKRYNIKNMFHFLRRSLRHTRAHAAWRLAQKLRLFGVATARPVAFIDTRYVGLRGKSYFVSEYLPGGHLDKYLCDVNLPKDKQMMMIEQVTLLLKQLAKIHVTHGDLKAANILLDTSGRPVFIDLDGAAEHSSVSSLHKAWRKEVQRFLKNFDNQPNIAEKFKYLLAETM